MFRTPSQLPEAARSAIAESLNARLADGVDLYTQVKVAHWNVKGPHFAPIHELFDRIAATAAEHNDDIAERLVTLGGRALGTARHTARASRLPEYPADATRDLDHVRHVAERLEKHLEGMREARDVADRNGDPNTVDMLTEMVTALEKHGWFLRATLEG
jgi:starvation-inducible DNA-binding protein